MKTTHSLGIHAARPCTRAGRLLPALWLSLPLLGVGLFPARAQDETLPLAANVDMLYVTVGQARVPVSFARINAGSYRFFPGINFKTALLRRGGAPVNIVDAQGRLAPSLSQGGNVEFTFSDYVNDSLYRSNLLTALRSQAGISPSAEFLPARTRPGRTARLVMADPAANGRVRILAEGPLNSSTTPEPVATFALTPGVLSELQRLQSAAANPAAHLNLFILQNYDAQFNTTDVQANLSFVEQSLNSLSQRLVSSPGRPRPTFMIGAYSPVSLPGGGSVDKETQFASMLRRTVQLEILQRQGSRPNEALVQRLLDDALRQVNLRVTPTDQERQNAIGALLLDDGIQITTPLATLSNVAASVRSDNQRQWSEAFERAVRNQGSSEIRGSVDVDIGWFGGGGSADFETIQRWDNSSYVNQKREDFARRLEEAAAQLSGALPVLTGMRFSQSGQLTSINFDDIRVRVGSFTIGEATLETDLSLRDYANTLGNAQQVEALRVPQVLVGGTNVVGSEGWYQIPGEWALSRDIPVAFQKPFATAPSVVAALRVVNNQTHPELVYAQAVNITANGFTMRFSAHPASRYYWAEAVWIATGESRSSATPGTFPSSLGAAGMPPLIPGEMRQALATPFVSHKLAVGGSGLEMLFNTIPGRTYTIQASTNLVDWQPLTNAVANDYELRLNTGDNLAYPQRFFRVLAP